MSDKIDGLEHIGARLGVRARKPSENPMIRVLDPMGDSCCRDILSRPGKLIASGPGGMRTIIYKCDGCGKVWLKVGKLPAYTLTKEGMDAYGFGRIMKGFKE